jgi:hypothetical protein
MPRFDDPSGAWPHGLGNDPFGQSIVGVIVLLDNRQKPCIFTNAQTNMSEHENDNESLHDLAFSNICTVKNGKFAGKTVLVVKAGVQTKFGVKAITVEYNGEHQTGEKIWVSPEQLTYNGADDTSTAEAIKEADYQEWKARKGAGVPPASGFGKPKTWQNRKESSEQDDRPF